MVLVGDLVVVDIVIVRDGSDLLIAKHLLLDLPMFLLNDDTLIHNPSLKRHLYHLCLAP